jgi:hypothetical protein
MFKQLLDACIFLGIPALFVGITSSVAWSQLAKPWLFIVLCLLVLYVLYIAIFYFSPPITLVSVDLFVPANDLQAKAGSGFTTGQENNVWFPFLRAYRQPILLFSVAALPTLWLAVKICRK